MIKNIVFDMGGVLFDFNPKEFVKRLDASEEEKQIVCDEVFNSCYWTLADYYMPLDEAFEHMKQNIPEHLHKSALDLARNWYTPDVVMQDMLELVKELKANGYKIYLLSNAGLEQPNYWSKSPFAEYFDATVISAYEKKWKPGLEIYKVLLDRYNLDPKECVFIDDLKNNIAASLIVGMNGIVFKNSVDTRRKLALLGVNVKHD